MGWLQFCQRQYPTHPWLKEGCRLIPFTDAEIKALGDIDGAEAGPKNNGTDSILKWKYWSGSRQITTLRGVNPHKVGKIHVDRMAIVKDIPFWAVRWLVFDRDKVCQDCGCKGYRYRYEHIPGKSEFSFYSSKKVYDQPIEEEFYHEPDPEDTLGLEVHHIIAVVDGGSNCTENLVLLCERCHDAKRGRGGVPEKSRVAPLTDFFQLPSAV